MTNPTPKTFTATDNLNTTRADALAVLRNYLVNPSDALGSYADQLAILETPVALTASLSDALGSYSDSLADFRELFAGILPDALGSYADTLAPREAFLVLPIAD